ncbi:MAG: 1-acyl-sn-glycerol-3-phosphate acyltransferase [Bacteroidia bacterium]
MIRGFYRRIQIEGYDKVPRDKPVIFAANHQNALIDALNVIYAANHKRQTTFLTRSDVFNHRFKGVMLGLFKMLPVYRQRDNLPNIVEKNAAIFDKCVDILDRDDVILLFPEGNHDRTLRIRPLKKGIVRIGFQAAIKSEYQKDIYVIPIGLNYTNHIKFHRDLFINFGEAINLRDYYELHQQNESKGLTTALKDIRTSIGNQVVNIRNKPYYPLIHGLQQMFAPELAVAQGAKSNDLSAQLAASKEIVAKLEAKVETDPEQIDQLQEQMLTYEEGLKKLKIRDHTISKGPHGLGKILGQELLLLLGLPFFLFGLVNNYIPYKASWWPARKFFKDDHFYSSITALAAYFIFPVFYLLLTIIVWIATANFTWAMAYLGAALFTGRFAIRYSEWVKKWWATWRHNRLSAKNDKTLIQITQIRTDLIAWVKKVVGKEKEAGLVNARD